MERRRAGVRVVVLQPARLALAERDPTPALLSLAKARSLIDATGYHRRDGELTTLESEAAALVGANQAGPQG